MCCWRFSQILFDDMSSNFRFSGKRLGFEILLPIKFPFATSSLSYGKAFSLTKARLERPDPDTLRKSKFLRPDSGRLHELALSITSDWARISGRKTLSGSRTPQRDRARTLLSSAYPTPMRSVRLPFHSLVMEQSTRSVLSLRIVIDEVSGLRRRSSSRKSSQLRLFSLRSRLWICL